MARTIGARPRAIGLYIGLGVGLGSTRARAMPMMSQKLYIQQISMLIHYSASSVTDFVSIDL